MQKLVICHNNRLVDRNWKRVIVLILIPLHRDGNLDICTPDLDPKEAVNGFKLLEFQDLTRPGHCVHTYHVLYTNMYIIYCMCVLQLTLCYYH